MSTNQDLTPVPADNGEATPPSPDQKPPLPAHPEPYLSKARFAAAITRSSPVNPV